MSIESLLPRLRLVGRLIAKDAGDGNPIAKRVIAYYTMMHRRPDKAMVALTEGALDDWLAARVAQEKESGSSGDAGGTPARATQ